MTGSVRITWAICPNRLSNHPFDPRHTMFAPTFRALREWEDPKKFPPACAFCHAPLELREGGV